MANRTRTAARACCHDCGKRQPASLMVYSRFTGNHYCLDFQACRRRAKRRAA